MVTYAVRPLGPDDIDFFVSYFVDADEALLLKIGVDLLKMPKREDFAASIERDLAKPLIEHERYILIWELDGERAGISSIDKIQYGKQANMHLHVTEEGDRMKGHGTEFVRRSVPVYFDTFDLQVLYCQPNAFNTAPNRALQQAGWRYVETVRCVPGWLNFHQPVTRWKFTREMMSNTYD